MDSTYDRIEALIEMRRYDEAVKLVRESLEKEPNDGELFTLWAKCELLKSNYADVEKLCKKALSIDAENFNAKFLLACGYNDNEKYDQSLKVLKELLNEDPEEPGVYYLLAASLYGKSDYVGALKAVDKALTYAPNDSDYLVLKSRIYRMKGDKAQAEFYANKAVNSAPDESDVLVEKGWVAIERGQVAESKELFAQGLAINPTNDYAKEGLKYALKSENWFFKIVFRFSLFLRGLSGNKRVFFILGIGALFLVLRRVADKLLMLGAVVAVAYLLLVVAVSTIDPLSNLALAANPYGRNLLRKEELLEAYVALAIWVVFFLVLGVNLCVGFSVMPAFAVLLLTFPVKRTFERWGKPSFRKFLVFTALMVAAAIYFCVGTWLSVEIDIVVAGLFFVGAVVASWMSLSQPSD
ncbi:MAG: tetratricopeptide repeat protein [Paludibacteraceae bacterium]|nr:tetratricopeptide repeat protein [Paludibacteraceae bacterium]